MISFDLANNPLPDIVTLVPLKAKELCYLRLSSMKNLSNDYIQFIAFAAKKTSCVILSVPSDDFDDSGERQKLLDLGIQGFAIQVTDKVEKFLKYSGLDNIFSGDLDIVDRYKACHAQMPEGKELLVEFQVGDDLRMIGPTIAAVHMLGSQSVILNVSGAPTRIKTSQFREVFEYLKIRALNRLNVYFPFWSPYFNEWDVKTQNTFSGLLHVHIDISNRCTHSCVFCSLYGPDAMENFKAAEGKVSKNMSDFMKMEIEVEKCLSIIRSLPWSVQNVQFGGVGDPLMHEHAVEFIAEVRKRGFRVEMLSNMEYLSEEDIKLISSLGGRNHYDIHFIANISGGTEEVYLRTRPRQTSRDFQKVIKNLELFRDLRIQNGGKGAHFTLMCVVNKLNCFDLEDVAKLALRLGAGQIWFKPMEIHGEVHKLNVPSPEHMKGFAKSLAGAFKICEENNLKIQHREYCDEIIKTYLGDTINV